MSFVHANNFSTTLNGAIDNSQTTIILTSVAGFPSIGGGINCYVTLQSGSTIEIVKATAISSFTLTVVRAQQGTSASSFADLSTVEIRPTAAVMDGKEDLISGRTLTTTTVATDDKVLLQDTSDGSNLKTVTAQAIADLATAYTDEQAQDAVGGMVDSTLVYTDATPLLSRAALTGDITASSGSNATTIANDAVTYAKIQNVSATDKLLGRSSSGSGDVEEITCTSAGRALIDDATASDQRTTLGLGTLATQSGTFSGTSSGTNTGDQTSIVGITGTKSQFDTAVTDGNILYVGDVTQYTDEMAQDATGAMVGTSIVYNDGSATLQRAALTGDVTASQDSNATTVVLPSSVTVATDDKIYLFDTSASDAKKYATAQSIADLSLTFKTISVSGQSDIVADNGTDTLTIVAGTNITLTTDNSTDTLTIAASGSGGGGFTRATASGTTQACAVDTYYVTTNAAQCVATLPATAAVGSVVRLSGQGAGGWQLKANTGQTVQGLGTATSSAGTVTPANRYDSIEVECVIANTTWVIANFTSTLLTFA